MEKRTLQVGDVVQIDPALERCYFRGCFMVVTDPKSWGAQGAICIPTSDHEPAGFAYYRATWDQMEMVGRAAWTPEPSVLTGKN